MAASSKFDGLDVGFGCTSCESIQFYSVCLALFLPVSNSIKIQYKLLSENIIAILNNLFPDVWLFTIMAAPAGAAIPYNIISIRAHYIHRIRQLRIEQSLATEESPYSHKATPGKEKT
jgi:hypothetical protein